LTHDLNPVPAREWPTQRAIQPRSPEPTSKCSSSSCSAPRFLASISDTGNFSGKTRELQWQDACQSERRSRRLQPEGPVPIHSPDRHLEFCIHRGSTAKIPTPSMQAHFFLNTARHPVAWGTGRNRSWSPPLVSCAGSVTYCSSGSMVRAAAIIRRVLRRGTVA